MLFGRSPISVADQPNTLPTASPQPMDMILTQSFWWGLRGRLLGAVITNCKFQNSHKSRLDRAVRGLLIQGWGIWYPSPPKTYNNPTNLSHVLPQVEDGQATVDFNHPLAGQALNFSVKLIACAEAPQVTVTTLSPGDGVTFPSKGDSLTMHYTGSLAATGAKFDSSVDRGMPFKFTIGVGQVIQGWDKGVMKMSVGEKARLEIPSDLGYGERGAGERIPPNADLVFEVELLKIN